MSSIVFDGRTVGFTEGQTILDVARDAGVDIPTLCHLRGVRASGVCRICVVEVAGMDRLMPSCDTPARDGMEVQTRSPRVEQERRLIVEMLFASGRHTCLDPASPSDDNPWHALPCPADGDCRLQELAHDYDITAPMVAPPETAFPLDDGHPMIVRDFSRCIQCDRCSLACNEVQVNAALPLRFLRREERPHQWYPVADYEKCTHCGECVQVCPTGALFDKKAFGVASRTETREVRTTCPYCGVGCQQILHVQDGRIVRVTGAEGVEPNRGRLCVKGRFGYEFIDSKDRLTTPLIRVDGELLPASWDEALDLIAMKFSDIIDTSGPDALAGVSCARSINEDSYEMQKLFRAVIGTNNIDHCART